MLFRKKTALVISAFVLSFFFCHLVQAMPVGTLLYRSSSDGNLYGHNTNELVIVKNKIVQNIYTGHVAIYIGKEDGVDYIVEAMPDGIIKVPAKYFLNSNNGEKLIGAKIPRGLSEIQRLKVSELAKKLAESNLAYDFDFKKQKGPATSEWICVGLTEKIYESANISNPLDISKLQYDPEKYAINITPDGFDNYSVVNLENGDCLSRDLEFSKISANRRTLLPLPEVFGFNAGLEYGGERYFFFPLTQYLQNTLEDVVVDIQLESDFSDDNIRGKVPKLAMIFRWSFVNNPLSSVSILADKVLTLFSGEEKILALDDDYSKSLPKESESLKENQNIINFSVEEPDNDALSIKENSSSKISLGKIQSSISVSGGGTATPVLNLDKVSLEVVTENSQESLEKKDNQVNNDFKNSNLSSADEDNFDFLNEVIKKLLISKIYTTGNNDYIEIYNPSDKAIYLEEFDLRIYKTKTSVSPSLMIRLGNLNDASYFGDKIIFPHSGYLITRPSASDYIKDQSRAISTRSDFTFTGNAYTIYLSNGVVSSNDDEDIIDKVGYGEAKYFYQKPCPEILDNHLLMRKAKSSSTSNSMSEGGSDYLLDPSHNSYNNYYDFVLIPFMSEKISSSTLNASSSSFLDPSSLNNSVSTNPGTSISPSNVSNSSTSTNATTTFSDNTGTSTVDSIEEATSSSPVILPLLISKIYTTGNDDYVEIYNPNDHSINLEEGGIRLYRAKTSVTPSLMMRIGNVSDGSYPGGVIIGPYGNYRIARSLASTDIKSMAQAIANRSEFSLTGDAYTIYLGKDTISSDNDTDIIDKVGYGNAFYYYNLPAPEILDNHVLARKASSTSLAVDMVEGGVHFLHGHGLDTKNNNFDFVLLDLNYDYLNQNEEDSDVGEEESNSDNEGGCDENENHEDDGEYGEIEGFENVGGYCLDPALVSENIIHLWHLDECSGFSTLDFSKNEYSEINSLWHEGKFGCALKQYYTNNYLSTTLDDSFDSNNFTLSFYYNNLFPNSRPEIKFLDSSSGGFFRIRLYPSNTDFYNIPYAPTRDYSLFWPNDNDWHLFNLVVNKPLNYLAIYRDGEKVYHINLNISQLIDVDKFYIKGDNGYNLMDEIAIFNRALSSEEITYIYEMDLPFNDNNCAGNNKILELIKYWDFNEEGGDIAYESISGNNLNVNTDSRIYHPVNKYLNLLPNDFFIGTIFSPYFYYQDLTVSFWLRNTLPGNDPDHQFFFSLMSDDKKMFGLENLGQDWFYYFNNYIFSIDDAYTFFSDNNWHQIVFSYDRYLHRLSLFVDGDLKKRWFKDCLDVHFIDWMILEANTSQDYHFDELGIWQGSFSENDANYYYNNQKLLFID